MISIIICSRHKEIPIALQKNIKETINCEYELVVIDNSLNKYSMFSAYNKGIQMSKFPYLCFVHDDIIFTTFSWGKNVISHLQKPNTGFIGVAGGLAVLRVPYDWAAYNPLCNVTHIRYDKKNQVIERKKLIPSSPTQKQTPCLVLDGLFLCTRKDVFDTISFDENFGGFHCYDVDICLQANECGYQNYVVYDIDIQHYSRGNFNRDYINTIFSLHDKWEKKLPVFDRTISTLSIEQTLCNAEKRTINLLKKRLVRSRIKINEASKIINDYILLTGKNKNRRSLFLINIELQLIKILSKIRKKMVAEKPS